MNRTDRKVRNLGWLVEVLVFGMVLYTLHSGTFKWVDKQACKGCTSAQVSEALKW